MSESSFERENEHTSLPIEAGEVSEFAKTIDEYDESQHDLNGAVATYFSNPHNKKSRTSLETAVGKIVSKFDDCVSQIHENELDIENRANSIAQLMIGGETVRLSAWGELVPNLEHETSQYNKESVVSAIRETYEQNDASDTEVRLAITKFFITGLQGDLGRTLAHADEHFSPHEIRKARMRTVGKNVLDVAKISLGVVGGIMAAKYINRRS